MSKINLLLSGFLSLAPCLFAVNPPGAAPSPTPRPATGKEEIAYQDRDSDFYDRNYYQNDWNYRQNWQDNSRPYLSGQNQPNSQYYNDNRGYSGRRYESSVPQYNNERDYLNWDYRQNWQYNPGPYLRGEDQSDYIENAYHKNDRYSRRNPNQSQNRTYQQTSNSR